eukprot:TRINITY_DN24565_c0_g2_i1.p2 TRINITY_DN24565_c0_g2~~TRINITY_DN24565_c0_g2_i1.p2  ORF type:complete len:120 (+),score=21.72 TRINITY_DN24565_c0_g2_i1:372-731(+)
MCGNLKRGLVAEIMEQTLEENEPFQREAMEFRGRPKDLDFLGLVLELETSSWASDGAERLWMPLLIVGVRSKELEQVRLSFILPCPSLLIPSSEEIDFLLTERKFWLDEENSSFILNLD